MEQLNAVRHVSLRGYVLTYPLITRLHLFILLYYEFYSLFKVSTLRIALVGKHNLNNQTLFTIFEFPRL
jgi:isoprenylcysteine carboxyl methyltransferase (ICMT) family protein YpbQ